MNPQTPARLTGSASMSFQNPVYVVSCASVVGKKEGEGPLGANLIWSAKNLCLERLPGKAAESTMQKSSRIGPWKSRTYSGDIRMTFIGDLLRTLPLLPLELPEWESHFTDFWCMLHHGEIPSSWRHVCCSRIRRTYSLCHFQPFCQRRKRIPISSGLRKPASSLSHVDGYRERCLCSLRNFACSGNSGKD